PGPVGTQVLGCTFAGTLGVASEPTVHITSATTKLDCATVSNTATGAASNDGQDTATASVEVQCANIAIAKTANPAGPVSSGDSIGFDIVVSNSGPGTAAGVAITDPLPAGGDLNWSISPLVTGCAISGPVGTQVLNCSFAGTLGVASEPTVHITSSTTQQDCATVSNTATGAASNDGSATSTASVAVQCPNLSITKTANPVGPVSAGDSIGFDITVSNAGPGTAHAVTVSDTLPAGLDLDWSINPSVTGCSIAGSVGAQTLTCSLGDMGAQTSQVIHVTSST